MMSVLAKGIGVLFLPAVLVALVSVSIYLMNLQTTAQFQSDISYCLSSAGTCDDYGAPHGVTVLSSKDQICTESNVPCLILNHQNEFDGFDDYTFTDDVLRRIAVDTTAEQMKYFPYLVPIMVISVLELVIRVLVFKRHISNNCQKDDIWIFIFMDMMFCVALVAICFAAGMSFKLILENRCDDTMYSEQCKVVDKFSLQVRSINTSPMHLSKFFTIYMISFGSLLLFGMVGWVLYVYLTSFSTMAASVHYELDSALNRKEEYTHALLRHLIADAVPTGRAAGDQSEEACAVCLSDLREAPTTEGEGEIVLGSQKTETAHQGSTLDADADNATVATASIDGTSGVKNHQCKRKVPVAVKCHCGHQFHYTCIHAWIRARWGVRSMKAEASCPLCRELVFAALSPECLPSPSEFDDSDAGDDWESIISAEL